MSLGTRGDHRIGQSMFKWVISRLLLRERACLLVVDKDIILVSKEGFKRNKSKCRPLVRCPSVLVRLSMHLSSIIRASVLAHRHPHPTLAFLPPTAGRELLYSVNGCSMLCRDKRNDFSHLPSHPLSVNKRASSEGWQIPKTRAKPRLFKPNRVYLVEEMRSQE
jgi:hypothetical protein